MSTSPAKHGIAIAARKNTERHTANAARLTSGSLSEYPQPWLTQYSTRFTLLYTFTVTECESWHFGHGLSTFDFFTLRWNAPARLGTTACAEEVGTRPVKVSLAAPGDTELQID